MSRYADPAVVRPAGARPRALWLALSLAGFGLGLAGLGTPAQAQTAQAQQPAATAGPTVRPEIGTALKAAQDALQAGNASEAVQKVGQAEAVGNLTPYEQYLVHRVRAAALLKAGDRAGALGALEPALASPHLPAAESASLTEAAISLAIETKDLPRARRLLEGALKAQGDSAKPELRRMYPQLLAQQGDHAAAAKEYEAWIKAEEAAGRAVPEDVLRQHVATLGRAGDDAAYEQGLARLAASTGKAEYQEELLQRAFSRNGFNREKHQLDMYRLRRAYGLPMSAAQTGDHAYLAHQAGLPAESVAVLDEGFKSGVLNTNNKNVAEDRKLLAQDRRGVEMDRKSLADSEASARRKADGGGLVALGMAVSAMGEHGKAVALIQEGIAKGGLKDAAQAQLQLGIAQARAGRKDDALATLAKVDGADGSAELARLWTSLLRSPQGPKKLL